jgi:hypothetical protein
MLKNSVPSLGRIFYTQEKYGLIQSTKPKTGKIQEDLSLQGMDIQKSFPHKSMLNACVKC